MGIVTLHGHWLGSSLPKPDPRYYGFPSHLIVRAGEQPPRFVLTGTIGLVKNQLRQGSCTAHAATSEGERLYRRWKSVEPTFSPAFHYYVERGIDGTLAEGDCGSSVPTSLMVARNGGNGFCPEALMPYNDADCSTAPSQEAMDAAAQNPGGSYHSIGNNIANIKSCIISDYSFVLGIAVYDSFENSHVELSGLVPLPNTGVESLQGFHEVHAGIVYDDTIKCPNTSMPGAVLCQNSWGDQWGTTCPIASGRGFFWLPYEFLMNPNLTTDVRMQHLGKPW